ncbi:MAG: AbrB/MazE/SpoVT family DNA-binding domain-containing protein [Candidatus Njordarchaeia archaeon]
MEIIVRIGRKHAIYIPKKIAERLGIDEGDIVKIRVIGNKIEIEKIEDPIELAIRGKNLHTLPQEK